MEKEFNEFIERIQLTQDQKEDAKTKYEGVCEKLHSEFYTSSYNGNSKFLFGSYKTLTNIRPIIPEQDVDVIFKIPEDEFNKYKNYQSNGPAALLDKIRVTLKEKYTTTDEIRAWGKIVLVRFTDGKHNVEVLPALELENGIFEIPNTENGGKWEIFDPRSQIDKVFQSNTKTEGLAIKFCQMIKTWKRQVASLNISSYQIENHVIAFFNFYLIQDKSIATIVKDFFEYLKLNIDSNNKSYVETAVARALKAIEYENSERYKEACTEWQKIFGADFPSFDESSLKKASIITAKPISSNPPNPWTSNV